MNFKTYADLAQDVKANAQKFQGGNYDLVVGIPRSGMIPAYMIALILNRPCTDLDNLLANGQLHKGARPLGSAVDRPSDAKRILLVDDSILAGKALQRTLAKIPAAIKEKVTTLAVYSSARMREDVDITLCYVPTPRVFEWNIFHHGVIADACVSIDGVLCTKPRQEQKEHTEQYRQFLETARPFILPTGKIGTVVTSRLETYRPETEAWLQQNNVQFDELVMLNLPTTETQPQQRARVQHKANFYKNSPHRLFIESEPGQASEIARIAQKPVFCVENNRMYMPNIAAQLANNPEKIRNYLKSFKPLVPEPAKTVLRPLYRFFIRLFDLGLRAAR